MIADNAFDDSSFKSICAGLKENSSLVELNLSIKHLIFICHLLLLYIFLIYNVTLEAKEQL